jgi:hypothetical protein
MKRPVYNLSDFRSKSVNEYITDFCRWEYDKQRMFEYLWKPVTGYEAQTSVDPTNPAGKNGFR